MCAYIYACIYMCVCIYIYVYIHTYIFLEDNVLFHYLYHRYCFYY